MDHAVVEVRKARHSEATKGLALVQLTALLGSQRLKTDLPSLFHGRNIIGVYPQISLHGVVLPFLQCRDARTRRSDRKITLTRRMWTLCIFGPWQANQTRSLSTTCLSGDPLFSLFGDHRYSKRRVSFADLHFRRFRVILVDDGLPQECLSFQSRTVGCLGRSSSVGRSCGIRCISRIV